MKNTLIIILSLFCLTASAQLGPHYPDNSRSNLSQYQYFRITKGMGIPYTNSTTMATALTDSIGNNFQLLVNGTLSINSGTPGTPFQYQPKVMTSPGDMIIGGTSGVATRLPVGGTGQVLQVSGGVPVWGSNINITGNVTAAGVFVLQAGAVQNVIFPSILAAASTSIRMPDQSGTLAIIDGINTGTDANYTVTSGNQLVKLPAITAARTVTLPAATNYTGMSIRIWNQNNSGTFLWTFSTTVKDPTGATITAIANQAITILESDGTNWVKIN